MKHLPYRLYLLSVLASGGFLAGEPAQPVKPATGPSAVAVEFFASGRDGVVFDLMAGEVSLRVDGRPRELRSLRFVSLPPAETLAPAPTATRDGDLPYGSNVQESAGRWLAVVLDHESVRAGAEKSVVAATIKMVSALGPRDHVALMTAPRGSLAIDFTTDHGKVVNALKRFVGSALRQETEQDRSCRSRLLLNAVEDVLAGMNTLEGPRLVTVISSGMLNPRRDNPANRAPGPCEITLDDFQRVGTAATNASAHVFVVQPDDYVMDAQTADRTAGRFASAEQDRGGLESLAGTAAGQFVRITSGEDDTLRNIARTTAGYYVATFDPEASERTGMPRRLQVTVRREGVAVRARPDVVIPKVAESAVQSRPPDQMLRDGVLYRALPLRMAASASLGADDKVNVVVALEAVEKGVQLASAVFGLFDARGQLAGKWTAGGAQLSTQPVVTAGEVRPGVYRLRAAVVDRTGRQGSVEYEVVARLEQAVSAQVERHRPRHHLRCALHSTVALRPRPGSGCATGEPTESPKRPKPSLRGSRFVLLATTGC